MLKLFGDADYRIEYLRQQVGVFMGIQMRGLQTRIHYLLHLTHQLVINTDAAERKQQLRYGRRESWRYPPAPGERRCPAADSRAPIPPRDRNAAPVAMSVVAVRIPRRWASTMP